MMQMRAHITVFAVSGVGVRFEKRFDMYEERGVRHFVRGDLSNIATAAVSGH